MTLFPDDVTTNTAGGREGGSAQMARASFTSLARHRHSVRTHVGGRGHGDVVQDAAPHPLALHHPPSAGGVLAVAEDEGVVPVQAGAVHGAGLKAEALLVRLVHVGGRDARVGGPVVAKHHPLGAGRCRQLPALPAHRGQRQQVLDVQHQVVLDAPRQPPHVGVVLGEEEEVEVGPLEGLVVEGGQVGEVELPLRVGGRVQREARDTAQHPPHPPPLGGVDGDVHVVVPRHQAVVAVGAEQGALEEEEGQAVLAARPHEDVQREQQLRPLLPRHGRPEAVDQRQLFRRLGVALRLLHQQPPLAVELGERVLLLQVLAHVGEVHLHRRHPSGSVGGVGVVAVRVRGVDGEVLVVHQHAHEAEAGVRAPGGGEDGEEDGVAQRGDEEYAEGDEGRHPQTAEGPSQGLVGPARHHAAAAAAAPPPGWGRAAITRLQHTAVNSVTSVTYSSIRHVQSHTCNTLPSPM